MINHDARWSLSRGKPPAPSPWQATSSISRFDLTGQTRVAAGQVSLRARPPLTAFSQTVGSTADMTAHAGQLMERDLQEWIPAD